MVSRQGDDSPDQAGGRHQRHDGSQQRPSAGRLLQAAGLAVLGRIAGFHGQRHRLGFDIGNPLIDPGAHLGQDALIDLLADLMIGRQRDITRINFLRRRLNWHVLGPIRDTPVPKPRVAL